MRCAIRTAVMLCLAGSLVFLGAAAAGADDLCPMGGTKVMVAIDKDKAVEWLDDEKRAYLLNEEGPWQIKLVSEASDNIGVVLTQEGVFFGVAHDRDDVEVDDRDISKVFGNELKFLKNAVSKDIKAMWQGEVIDIGGGDVQKIVDAAGLGVVSQDGRDWELATEDCQGLKINLEELD